LVSLGVGKFSPQGIVFDRIIKFAKLLVTLCWCRYGICFRVMRGAPQVADTGVVRSVALAEKRFAQISCKSL
jgi:hypothetical protein